MMNFIYSVVIALILDGFNVIASYEELYIDEDNIAEILADGASTHSTKIEIGSEELLNPHDYSRIVKKYECMKELNLSSIGKIVDFTFLRFSPRRLRNIKFSDRVSRHYGLSSAELSASLLASLKLPPVFTSLSNPGSSVTKPMREKTGVGCTFERFPVLEHSMIVPKKRRKARKVDGRVRVDSLTDVTHRAQGVVNFRVRSAGKRASGTLIGKNMVLTAAHNVYDIERGEEHRALQFAAGFDGKEYKYGVQEVEEIYYPTAYAEGDDSEDYALLILDESIGVSTGYLGLSVLGDAELLDKELHVTGYPGEAEDKSLDYQLCTMSGRTEAELVSDHFVGYYIDTSAGQSGSAVWFKGRDGNDYVAAVHVRASATENYNEGVRITKSRLFQINEWIRQYNQTQLGEQYDGWLKATFGAKRARSLYECSVDQSPFAQKLLDQLSGVGSGMSTPVTSTRVLPTRGFAGTASSGVGSTAGSPLSTRNPDSSASAAGTPTAVADDLDHELAMLRAQAEERNRKKAEEEARLVKEEEIAKLRAELNAEREEEVRKVAEALRQQQEAERRKAEQEKKAKEAEIARLRAEAKAEEERQLEVRRQSQLQEQKRKEETVKQARELEAKKLQEEKLRKSREAAEKRAEDAREKRRSELSTPKARSFSTQFELDKYEAGQGNAEAMYRLGSSFYNGSGIEKNVEEGLRWIRSSSSKGHALARDFIERYEAEQAEREVALKALEQSRSPDLATIKLNAKRGDLESMYKLGIAYFNGEGVDKNIEESWRLLNAAALKGHKLSREFVIKIESEYSSEKRTDPVPGVLQSLPYNVELIKGFADDFKDLISGLRPHQGCNPGEAALSVYNSVSRSYGNMNSHVMYMKGCLYEYGARGFLKDEATAIHWYCEAQKKGSKHAAKALERLKLQHQKKTKEQELKSEQAERLRRSREAAEKRAASASLRLTDDVSASEVLQSVASAAESISTKNPCDDVCSTDCVPCFRLGQYSNIMILDISIKEKNDIIAVIADLAISEQQEIQEMLGFLAPHEKTSLDTLAFFLRTVPHDDRTMVVNKLFQLFNSKNCAGSVFDFCHKILGLYKGVGMGTVKKPCIIVKFVDFVCKGSPEMDLLRQKYGGNHYEVLWYLFNVPLEKREEATKKAIKALRFVRKDYNNAEKITDILWKFR